MNTRILSLFALVAAAAVAPQAALAEEMRPVAARTIAMGSIGGVAYYTVEPDGLRLVATVMAGDAALRVVSTLATDQTLSLAVAGAEGEPARTLSFTHRDDRIQVVDSEPQLGTPAAALQ